MVPPPSELFHNVRLGHQATPLSGGCKLVCADICHDVHPGHQAPPYQDVCHIFVEFQYVCHKFTESSFTSPMVTKVCDIWVSIEGFSKFVTYILKFSKFVTYILTEGYQGVPNRGVPRAFRTAEVGVPRAFRTAEGGVPRVLHTAEGMSHKHYPQQKWGTTSVTHYARQKGGYHKCYIRSN